MDQFAGGRSRRGTTFAAVLAVGAFFSVIVAVAQPPWEAPDEPDHVQNVETLVGGRWYHIGDPGSGFESHQAPLYYLLLAGWQHYVLRIAERPILPASPRGSVFGLPRLYRHDVVQDGADQRLVTLLRLVSVMLGLLTVLLTRMMIGQVTSDQWTPVVGAAFVVGVPRFVSLSGVVNNDNLAITLGAAFLLGCTTLLAGRSRIPRLALAVGCGVLVGLLTLTKVTGALLAPAAIAAFWFGAAGGWELAACVVAFFLAALAISGWWFVTNTMQYGDPLAAAATVRHLRAVWPLVFQVGSPAHQVLVGVPAGVFNSFWCGSDLLWLPLYPYEPLWIALGVGIAGLIRYRVPLVRPAGTLTVLGVAVLGSAMAIWAVGIGTTTASARVGFFGLPALAALYALGVERWRLPVALRFALPIIGMAFGWITIVEHVLGFFPS